MRYTFPYRFDPTYQATIDCVIIDSFYSLYEKPDRWPAEKEKPLFVGSIARPTAPNESQSAIL
ncbi:MAG: hypothetical protein OXC30_01315 [Alphaproteobacteria bacterium]|nr:hypothetical protein [Alphaproteobacteria bacterium]